MDTTVQIAHQKSDKVLDGNGENIYFETSNDGDYQHWIVRKIDDSDYEILHSRSGKMLCGIDDEVYFAQPGYYDKDEQEKDKHTNEQYRIWQIIPYENDRGFVRIVHKQTGRSLDGNGKKIYLEQKNDDGYQKWAQNVVMHNRASWMQNLRDDLMLDQLSIPGTHDSGTSKLSWFTTDRWARCQNDTIAEQLEKGIRYLDIRCRHFNDSLLIHHSKYYCHISIKDVLNDCVSFLKRFPSETILMCIKEEYKSGGNTENLDFGQKIISEIAPYEPYVFMKPVKAKYPQLGEVRGKIVLIRRFEMPLGYEVKGHGMVSDAAPVGIDGNIWDDNRISDKNPLIYLQDIYRIDELEVKKRAIAETVTKAGDNKQDDKLYLNYVSFTTSYKTPAGVEEELNKTALKVVKNATGRIGVIIMDFPPLVLIDQIIAANFR